MTPLTASEALMASRIATAITVDLIALSALQGEGVLALGVKKSFRSRGHGMVRLAYPRRGADNSSLPGHTLRRGPEGHDKAARDGRHLADSVNHGANMPTHGSSASSASAVSAKRSRVCGMKPS